MAQHTAISLGKIDLYKRAQRISENMAKQIVRIAQNENANFEPTDEIDEEVTDDEDFHKSVR